MSKTKPHIESLLMACGAEVNTDHRGVSEAIADPQWDSASKCHDWRNHVDGVVKELWNELGIEARLVAYLTAAVAADREQWD